MRLRTALASLLTAAALVVSVVATATPAAASTLDVTCAGSDSITFTPPLTLAPQTVTISASTQYGPCTSSSVPGLTAGSRSFTINATRSCLDLLNSAPVTFTITWNTGQQSTVSGNATASHVGAALVVTITGNVTAGLFAGDSVVHTATGPATNTVLCTAGLGTVSSIYSLVTLEITSLP